jgi:hypothetical protein
MPLVQMAFHPFPEPSALAENRTRAAPPRLAAARRGGAKAFVRDFERYLGDNFGFRDGLIEAHHALVYRALRTTTSDSIVLGEEGWLYYDTPLDGDSLRDFCGLRPFEDGQLDAIERNLTTLSSFLRERNVLLAVLIAPNKDSVYPEHLPAKVRSLAGESRLAQFLRRLAGRRDLLLVDPRPALTAGKARAPVFFKTDTHWNGYGAFIAYRELMGAVARAGAGIAEAREEDFGSERVDAKVRDLGLMLGVPGFPGEADLERRRLAPPPVRVERQPVRRRRNPRQGTVVCETDDPKRPRMVMLRDSFAHALQPLLCPDFSRSVYLWQYTLDKRTLEEEKPSVVVLEIVERNLGHLSSGKMLEDPGIGLRRSPVGK